MTNKFIYTQNDKVKQYLIERGSILLKTTSNGISVFLYDQSLQCYDAIGSNDFIVSETLSF